MCIQSMPFMHFNLEWDGGLVADFDVTSDHDGSSYTLVLTFDQDITLEQWSGTASSTDQKYVSN